ncbi:glutathione S-transferase family protein [Pseudomonas zhanjiangensis]|uniref:Glutathione S-transferase family protein n=1 Tax=Pseudomonas zhanjiangensis TaxID=3239015 RepID=A0ABV3YVD1_9PSED
MLKVYGDYRSGNGYKVRLLLQVLGREHRWIAGDGLGGEPHRTNDLAGAEEPVVELECGSCLRGANAILNRLAAGSALLPRVPYLRTQVLQWQFFEQYSHEPNVALARFIQLYQGLPEARREEYAACKARGYKALKVMEQQLRRTPYLVGDDYSIADIALYAYTHVAHQGGFDLGAYPAICAWLQRVARHPRHIDMHD